MDKQSGRIGSSRPPSWNLLSVYLRASFLAVPGRTNGVGIRTRLPGDVVRLVSLAIVSGSRATRKQPANFRIADHPEVDLTTQY